MLSLLRRLFLRFCRDQHGVSVIVFALTLPMMMAASGMAVDLAKAYNVKVRLGNALDKAALAAGTVSGTNEEVEARILEFVRANYPDRSIGEAINIVATVNEMSISVTAEARVETIFMRIFGYDEITVSEESEVIRELSGVEVVLVLDVTGSMAGNNIRALRTASQDFLEIMFSRISDEEYIRVGIVPFSNSVNVGAAGLADGFVRRPSSDSYISPASSIQYSSTNGTTTSWKGCVVENPFDGTDVTDPSKVWDMYRWPRTCTRTDRNGNCTSWSGNANNLCTNLRIQPLTNDRALLDGLVAQLTDTNAAGNTYGNIGMVWGWRVISPDAPFTQGSQYGDVDWSKAVIMMTDGDNTMDGTYSAYGRTSSHGMNADDLDERFAETCENMKEEGITVYTITFQSGISNATRQIFRTCATSPDHYFNAPSNSDLQVAFRRIANQLSALHLSK